VFTVMATGSMRPTFDEKAFLVVEPTPYEKLQIGDVITFIHPKLGAPIVHRIFEKRGESFWTKGDYNTRPDSEYVTRGNYGMRVVAVIYGREDSNRVAGLTAGRNATAMLN
jgi:signal peptidase I